MPLTRQDDARGGIGAFVTFEPDAVRQTIERLGVRLPAPMLAGARVGVLVDDVVLILRALPERPAATLIVDANMNRDLTDDAVIDVRTDGADESAVVVRIKRSYPGPPPSEAWLPYRFWTGQARRPAGNGSRKSSRPPITVWMAPSRSTAGPTSSN